MEYPNQVITLLNLATTTAIGCSINMGTADHTYQATVTGTGAVTATVVIEASNDNVNFLTLGTITLSGTDSDSDGFSVRERWAYKRAKISAISGTNAAVTCLMGV